MNSIQKEGKSIDQDISNLSNSNIGLSYEGFFHQPFSGNISYNQSQFAS